MANESRLPKWSTPERRNALIDLFNRSGGFCVLGHKNCPIPEHHYINFVDDIIRDWIQSDRQERQALLDAEMRELHSLHERRYPVRGQFSAISREIWGATQPLYYIENLGISGLDFQPFAKVRLSSSFMRLYVNLGDSLRQVSKSQRRKAVRYGKPLPTSTENTINKIVRDAVRHYLDH